MQITCNHSSSSHGIPVILDHNGNAMDYPAGLTAVLEEIGWDRKKLAEASDYKTYRSIEKFWQDVPPSAQLLNVLKVELEKISDNKPIEIYPETLEKIKQDPADPNFTLENEVNRMINCYATLLANTSIKGLFTVQEWTAILNANNGRMWSPTEALGMALCVADTPCAHQFGVDEKELATKMFHLDVAKKFKLAEVVHDFWTPPAYNGSIEDFLVDRKLVETEKV